MLRTIKYLAPLLLFVGIVLLLANGLKLHPNQIPSPLINEAAPSFQLPVLDNQKQTLSNKDFLGKVTLLNVWASWCMACREEHAVLLKLAKQKNITLYGLNYKDNPEDAKQWLKSNDNPYQLVALDTDGQVAIDWGVYGTPETFIIDKKGIIRAKQLGPITQEEWDENLAPLITKLIGES